MDLSNWDCLECRTPFRPADPDADNACPECGSTLAFPVVPVTEIH